MYRAGGVAAALALAVSGGAYAAVQVTGPDDAQPMTESQARLQDIADTSAPDVDVSAPEAEESSELSVEGDQSSVTTVTEDVTDAHSSSQQETDSLPQGQTQVGTAGVDGVSRVTYQVTMRDGQEVSREVISSVVVTQRVDEVVLVGTGTAAAAPADAPAVSSAPAAQTAAAGTDAASAQAVARSMMGSYGWGDDQFSCLVSLWNRESSWDYQAENSSSGAYGIPQSLPGSKMGSVGADWRTNPTTQIVWGLGYISGRYGSPCSAWAHSEATGWY